MYTYVIFSKKSYFHDSVPLTLHYCALQTEAVSY